MSINIRLQSWIAETLENLKITKLTTIQEKTLPLALAGESLVITSPTGTGKTYCYLLPIINRIDLSQKASQALIILPTKELARQVHSKIIDFKKTNPLLTAALAIGNTDLGNQSTSFKSKKPHIVVSTVNRALEFLKSKAIDRNLKIIALDEADMLFDLGFTNQINEIFTLLSNPNLQKFACSATLHSSLANALKNYLKNSRVVSTSESIWINDRLRHHVVYTNNNQDPYQTLYRLVSAITPYFGIIFANTKKETETIYQGLLNKGMNVAVLHKDLTTRQRKNIYRDLKNNTYQLLVATDLMSRGLDIDGADVVISFGLPEDDIWYIHRAGRTGRNNSKGNVYVIYQNGIDNKLLRLSKKNINWNYLMISKENELISKPLALRIQKKKLFDQETNAKIKQIINVNSKKVKPGYKRKIKAQIHKIKQKKRHEFIEAKIKKTLLHKNIERTKEKSRY